ncbi:hypothetical protein [Pseudomonas fluorescens]|uniref:Uncharacterized protein n=1 Tax=Pseudomonas fluorescens TaxID=294 RepID=A0A5E7RW45_PSEFL|nr:hypothetical protein [Pseudomonas fluorescens]VVP78556.1 hypothetical protein PS928_00492 [Pseudomonas fluorescens]
MARVNQEKSEKPPVGGDGNSGVTSVDQNVTPTDVDAEAVTIFSPVVDSSLLSLGAADADNQLVIYPIRSYLDGKEIRQAGGVGYASPKHEALLLIAKGLATDQKPGA